MSLDSKQKRGSVIGIALPWRQWLVEPDGTIAAEDRLSVLRYSGAISPAAAEVVIGDGSICTEAGMAFVLGLRAPGDAFVVGLRVPGAANCGKGC